MMDFVTVEKGKIMAEYITCRRCDSPDCKGCNLKRLETMLGNGKFDCLMNENRAIGTSADVATVRHGKWIPAVHVGDCCYHCSECQFLRDAYLIDIGNYCPNCGAKMDGECDS